MKRGRPRNFETDDVLDSALKVFWEHGFQSTNLSELTKATGLSKPSLYAAFGDKKSLYLTVLERYINLLSERHVGILTNEPNGRQAIEAFLHSLVNMFTNPNLPGGCFIITGTADIGGLSVPKEIEVALHSALNNTETLIEQRLLKAQRDGQLQEGTNLKDLCKLFTTLIAGLAVQAKCGTSESTLNMVVTATMDTWPSSS